MNKYKPKKAIFGHQYLSIEEYLEFDIDVKSTIATSSNINNKNIE